MANRDFKETMRAMRQGEAQSESAGRLAEAEQRRKDAAEPLDTGVAGALEVDCTPTQGLELTAEVTDFPVEQGSAITDHVRPMNGTITLEGVISNTPFVLPSTQMQGITLAPASVVLEGGSGQARATMLRWSDVFDRRKVCDTILAGLVSSATPINR